MDLKQRKLTKTEWVNIEIPVSADEKRILEVIVKGSLNIDYFENDILSIINYLKIEVSNDMMSYLYETYFKSTIDKHIKSYKLDYNNKIKFNSKKVKKADTIRIQNLDKSLTDKKSIIFEYIILDIINNIFKKPHKQEYYYYSLKYLVNLKVSNINLHLMDYIKYVVSKIKPDINYMNIIKHGVDIIEKNEYTFKYQDIKLYEHQKQLFTIMNNNSNISKLILYCAPTGTGKTLSPIGLASKYKIIFVCAARHVGLALAKSCISVGKKVAFAFGCESPGDIRLHYFAATDYTRDWNTGGIRKVDNSVGDKVEIIISDIKSYLCAMNYMKAFNDKKDIVMYWDEPTIGLDYETHELHQYITKIWQENDINNIILSSATLPKEDEIRDTINDFRCKFKDAEIYPINSYDCKKSITILDTNNYKIVPHILCKNYDELKQCVQHCVNNKTILRYLDFDCINKFIINTQPIIDDYLKIDNYFDSINKFTMDNIKIYYLTIVSKLTPEQWNSINIEASKFADSTINITTKDSHTLTDGPTIYIADDIDKIGKFCITTAKIPHQVTLDIKENIEFNNKLAEKIDVLDKKFEDMTKKDEDKENKMSKERFSPEVKKVKTEADALRSKVKAIELHQMFIPNKPEHMDKWVGTPIKSVFSCDIETKIVERIMLLDDVDNNMKLLLLMGIGVLKTHNSIAYTEIMKELAINQKLFIIIASSDFIYGTNYQFCHSYIGKDLSNLTQEKTIQALGRVGRGKLQQTYTIRFRDDDLIKKIFMPDDNKPEVINMNKLFNTPI